MKNFDDNIPIVVAAQIGHKDMVHFLYEEYLKADSIKHAARTFSREADSSKHAAVRTSSLKADWARLLTSCITSKLYDIALDMVKNYKELSIAALKDTKGEPLNSLARRRTAFESGSDHFAFWQRWICSCLHVQPARGSSNILVELSQLLRNFLKYVPFIKHTYETKKLENAQARHLLSCICEQTSTLPGREIPAILCSPVLTAVLCGNVGFIAEVAKTHPDILWLENGKEGRPLFSTAISERQEKVFSYLRRMGATQCLLATTPDEKKNNILHQAAVLAPPHQLGRISGAALQMQREVQWFKEVEKIAPVYTEAVNNKDKTPRALFTEEHRELVKEGEKWMKETARSCTVVAALIVTIMFAAAFTVPGGYDGNIGIPVYLHSNYFIIFIISDALSLFFSTISVLVFLVILTSLYREEDFRISLPTKLMLGLAALCFSIAAMMITFGAAIVIMLQERFVWISLPVLISASIPVVLFVLWQFPLFIQIIWSTYGPGIFDR